VFGLDKYMGCTLLCHCMGTRVLVLLLLYDCCCREQVVKLLGFLLAGSISQQWQVGVGWPDIHWLARAQGGLVAAILRWGSVPISRWSLTWLLVGGAAPAGALTLMRPFGNGNGI
jgi:hypothetical protein